MYRRNALLGFAIAQKLFKYTLIIGKIKLQASRIMKETDYVIIF